MAVFDGLDWSTLDMGEIHDLMRFVADNCEISTVQNIVYGSLIAGDIVIQTADDIDARQRGGQSDRVEALPAREEAAQRMRSSMWATCTIDSLKQEDLIGFSCNSFTPNSPDFAMIADTDPSRPCVLQLDKLARILHRVDVLGMHSFRFFAAGRDGKEVEIPNVKVTGAELPNAQGRINSKIKRLKSAPFKLYSDKMANTARADYARANPRLITQVDNGSGSGAAARTDARQIMTSIGINENHEAMPIPHILTAAEAAQSAAVADAVAMHNCAGSGSHPMAMPGVATARKRKDPDAPSEYELPPGRILAPNYHIPEAPADMLSAKQAWIETVCLAFQIPMSMLSAGDATGKAKLNKESAGSDASRIYLEAQSARKRKLEGWIGAMYMVS